MSKVAKQYERSYRDRREHLLKALDEPYQCVWVGSGHAQRSHGDVYFKHRPRSDFLYLSGVERENCILVLLKNRSHTKHIRECCRRPLFSNILRIVGCKLPV